MLGTGADAEAFSLVYGLKREPNFDGGRYVLLQPRPLAEQAGKLQSSCRKPGGATGAAPRRLLAARESGPPPAR